MKARYGSFFGPQRFEFKPTMSFEMSGVAVEIVLKGNEFFDAQLGVTAIMGWNVGECVCLHQNATVAKEGQEAEDTEEKVKLSADITCMFLKVPINPFRNYSIMHGQVGKLYILLTLK